MRPHQVQIHTPPAGSDCAVQFQYGPSAPAYFIEPGMAESKLPYHPFVSALVECRLGADVCVLQHQFVNSCRNVNPWYLWSDLTADELAFLASPNCNQMEDNTRPAPKP